MRSGEKLACQQPPARKGTDQQRAHATGLAVIDHGQGRLHAVEELNHRDQARRDIDFVENISVIGWDDRDSEYLPETSCKNEKPDKRAHQGRDETLALMQEAERLAPDNAAKADRNIARSDEAARVVVSRSALIARSPARRRRPFHVSLAKAARSVSLARRCLRYVVERSARPHAAFMQHDDIVVRRDFVNQMSRPQHADASRLRGADARAKNVGARLDVEPRPSARRAAIACGRCINARAISTRRNLTAREIGDPVVGPIG